MDTTSLVLLAIPLLFMASLVQTMIGFGGALIAIPIMTLFAGAPRSIPVMAFISIVIAVIVIISQGRHVRVKDMAHFIAATIIGLPLGIWLLKSPHQGLLQILLGVTVTSFALYKLCHPDLFHLQTDRLLYPFGFLAGILGGAFAINGPPITIYGNLRQWSPDQFRATLQGYFLITAIIISGAHGMSGLWTKELFIVVGCAVPGVIIATLLGLKLGRRIRPGKFDKLVYIFLIFTGGMMCISPFLTE